MSLPPLPPSALPLLLLLQLLFDLAILVGLLLLHRRIASVRSVAWEEMSRATQEALRLARELEKNLEEKRRLVARLERAAERLREEAPREDGARARARRLLQEGLSREEVAERTGLPLEEIELMATLKGGGGRSKGWRA